VGANVNATIHEGDTRLMYLVRFSEPIMSQLMIVCLLLATKCDINQELQDRDMALVIACHCYTMGSDELVCWLLKHGARMFNYCTPYDDDANALTFIKAVSCLLDHGMDVNAKDAEGRTAIHWAVTKCNTNLVCLLLDHNTNMSIQDGSGWTVLMAVCLCILRDNEIQIIGMLSDRKNTVDKKLIDLSDFLDTLSFILQQEVTPGK